MRGVVIGGTASGVGKTVATLVAMRALESAGYEVQPAKAGPDFIDPSHHEAIVEVPSRTLDPWLQGEAGLLRNYWRGRGDVCVIEGVMGLYDGSMTSTAHVASLLDVPVVLVVDASAGMQSVAATALGFRAYAEHAGVDVDVVGVIAGRAHGGSHEAGIRDALPDSLAYLGRIPPNPALEVPERHLGLHMGSESSVSGEALDRAATHLDVDRLVGFAREPPTVEPDLARSRTDARVVVASDEAFCFSYPATIERLRERADVVSVSPIAGDPLPACDGIYLPGGYPERRGDELQSSPTLDDIADRASDGVPVFGECGGMMALSESLTTIGGETFEMAGVLPARVRMHDRYRALDHVELVARSDALTASVGTCLRGHEFHYSGAEVGRDARFAFDLERGTGIDGEHDGLTEYRSLGTYAHVHPECGAFDTFMENL